jgi:hypothetical protein
MNGFVNTLLSAMLSWIRALVSNLWILLTSEDGGTFFRFFSVHWLTIVIFLCAACVLVDLIVYFFRWRPDYVWASKWRRLRRKRPSRAAEPEEDLQPQEAFSAYQPPVQPEAPTAAYAPLQAATAVYAPVSQPTQVWQPVQEETDELVFDDALWESDEPMDLDWEQPEEPAFGAARPEPLTYFRDVQAGFAPPVPPEQLYAPPAAYQPETETTAVHPGLDEETFRQSVGLAERTAPPSAPVIHGPAFRPFTVTAEPEPEKPQGALQRFAQKARDLIALDDEQKTIRDLQSSVHVSKAFHEPVYPQSFKHDEE